MAWNPSNTGVDPPKPPPPMMGHHAQQAKRRQGIGTRVWLVISQAGDSRLDEVTKSHIMRRTGLPARDLRALDPVLSYPSSILGRERAVVINLEHIKAIITATEVLMVNSSNPLVVEFVEDLRHRISDASLHQAKDSHEPYMVDERTATSSKGRRRGVGVDSSSAEMKGDISEEAAQDQPSSSVHKPLPFEFRALEACFESSCKCLESETRMLEQEAYPALDELTSQISTLNLERVRQIKSRLVAISGRVLKVRDELEHLLDDDNDMAEMYLTEKLKQSMEQMSMREEPADDPDETDDEMEDEDSKSGRNSESFTYAKPNVEELEMLLEAYFAQVDGISQKLSTMSEYVGDTEDYINIMLDDKQNQLLQMGVLLSLATLIINAGIVVAGIFGMNIHISLFDGDPRPEFLETVLGTVGGCIILYIIAIGWGKKRFLLSM